MRTLEEKMKSQNALIFAVLLLAASAVQAQTYTITRMGLFG